MAATISIFARSRATTGSARLGRKARGRQRHEAALYTPPSIYSDRGFFAIRPANWVMLMEVACFAFFSAAGR